LIVWQKSLDFSLRVYRQTRKFPKEELYGLISQIRRCAVSIPSNIAEGYSRYSKAEYVRFLQIAFASPAELEIQLLIAKELKYIENEDYQKLDVLLQENMRMLNVLIRKLKN